MVFSVSSSGSYSYCGTSHEDIRTIVNVARPPVTERRDSDIAEHTIVHRTHAVRFAEDDAALSRASSFSDGNGSPTECHECAKHKRALSEEKTKRQEILLTAINCIPFL
eukprot:Phypoly_transcript_21332.p1 GENE.Phypoly_transcript_21332~~Phypoly_transcript_21332.p1  ORF type:complete len:109 (+),score=18.27 Phypoly_transcript_21332:154-480(+)